MQIKLTPGNYFDTQAGMSRVAVRNDTPQNGKIEVTIDGKTEKHDVLSSGMRTVEVPAKKTARINNVGAGDLRLDV